MSSVVFGMDGGRTGDEVVAVNVITIAVAVVVTSLRSIQLSLVGPKVSGKVGMSESMIATVTLLLPYTP